MHEEWTTEEALRDNGWKAMSLPGHMGQVGPLWARREAEGWTYGLLASTRHLNPAGVVHGGAIATLVDHALSLIGWQAAARQPCVTVQMNIQYLEAAQARQFLVARGRVTRGGNSLLFLTGSVQAEEVEIAQASAVLRVLKMTPTS